MLEKRRRLNKDNLRKMILLHALWIFIVPILMFATIMVDFNTFMVIVTSIASIISLIIYLKMLYHLYNNVY